MGVRLTALGYQLRGHAGDKVVAGRGDDDIGLFLLPPFNGFPQSRHFGPGRLTQGHTGMDGFVALQQLERKPVRVNGAHCAEFAQIFGQGGPSRLDRLRIDDLGRDLGGLSGKRGDRGFEFAEPLIFCRHQGNNRATETSGKSGDIDLDAPFRRHVHHVEGNDHGQAHLQQLAGEIEVALDIGGVNDVHNQCGLPRQQEISGDLLVQAGGGQAVYSRGVDHFHREVVESVGAGFAVHGDAGPVADPLPGAGQAVEQCGFTAVGVADNAYYQVFHCPTSRTRRSLASSRRRLRA